MSDALNTSIESVVNPATEPAAVEAPAEAVENSDQLPEWAREKLSKANAEAAKYRTERNAAQEALDAAKAFETQLSAEATSHLETKTALEAATLNLLKLTAALEAGVPADKANQVASRIQGTTADEIKADAQVVVGLLGASAPAARTPAVDPSPAGTAPMALNDESALQGKFRELGLI